MVHCHRNDKKNRDKNIAVLLENLPHSLRGLWLSLEEILKILHDGGAKSVSCKELRCIFSRSDKIKSIFHVEAFKQIRYYSYGQSLNPINLDLSTPRTGWLNISVDFYKFFRSCLSQEALNNLESDVRSTPDNQKKITTTTPKIFYLTSYRILHKILYETLVDPSIK